MPSAPYESFDLAEVGTWKKFFLSDLQTVTLDFIDVIETPALIVLDGDLGAGKTTFTKSFTENYLEGHAQLFNKDFESSQVTSPTYSLINEFGPIAHADLYRIEDEEDLVHLEIELYLDEKELFFVEWGRKYLRYLSTHIPEEWQIYLAEFQINASEDGSNKGSRNLTLQQILF